MMAKRKSFDDYDENIQRLLMTMRVSSRVVRYDENGTNQLLAKYDITEAQFKTLCKHKILARDNHNGRCDVVLGSSGKQMLKLEFGEIYKPSSETHDVGVAEVCETLTMEELRGVLTPAQFMEQHGVNHGTEGTPDIIVPTSDGYRCVEIVTDNYRQRDIELKQEWASNYGLSIDFKRI